MSTSATFPLVQLSRRQLNRALLARQMLLERTPAALTDVIERLVGLQSQTPNSPYVALWSRVADFSPQALGQLISDRRTVRIALQRSTIHLVSAADCLALRPVLQPVITRSLSGNYRHQLEGVDIALLEAAGRKLVDEQPRTFAELGALLSPHFSGRDPQALAMGVRAAVALVQVPPRGVWGQSGLARHTSAEAWLGRLLGTDATADELVLRYLRAFGPATVRDAQTWSGLTRLNEVIARLRPQLRSFTDEHGAHLWDVHDGLMPDADSPAPVRFLPDYDNVLLSHADRTRVIAAEHRPLIFSGNGVHATVLVDGFAAARWSVDRGTPTTLVIQPFARLTAADRGAIAEEAVGLLELLAPDSPTDGALLCSVAIGRGS